MEHYKIKRFDVAQAWINIIKRYPWYHDQGTVIFNLVEEDLFKTTRKCVNKMLMQNIQLAPKKVL